MLLFNARRYTGYVDRLDWPSGPWDREPDRVEFIHPPTGHMCTARRGPLGSWCGYVALPPGHPRFSVDIDHQEGIYIHGGITFATVCEVVAHKNWINWRKRFHKAKKEAAVWPQGDSARLVRELGDGHVVETFERFLLYARLRGLCHPNCPHGMKWVGFDCSHSNDLVPGLEAARVQAGLRFSNSDVYRDVYYVIEETLILADQLERGDDNGKSTDD